MLALLVPSCYITHINKPEIEMNQQELNKAFGFEAELVSTKEYPADEINSIGPRTRITVKRPNGKKQYHGMQYENGEIRAF